VKKIGPGRIANVHPASRAPPPPEHPQRHEVQQDDGGGGQRDVEDEDQLVVGADDPVAQRHEEREARRPPRGGGPEELRVPAPVGQVAGGDLVEERVVGARGDAPVDEDPGDAQDERDDRQQSEVTGVWTQETDDARSG
jgi:hypothetical protein